MKKILITGADGFIGSHLLESLVRQGYKVRAFVFYNSFGSWGWLDHCAPDMKVEIEIITDQIRLRPKKSEVERLWADNSKAKKLIGWKPNYIGHKGLELGLTKTIEWFSEPKNLILYKTNIYNL